MHGQHMVLVDGGAGAAGGARAHTSSPGNCFGQKGRCQREIAVESSLRVFVIACPLAWAATAAARSSSAGAGAAAAAPLPCFDAALRAWATRVSWQLRLAGLLWVLQGRVLPQISLRGVHSIKRHHCVRLDVRHACAPMQRWLVAAQQCCRTTKSAHMSVRMHQRCASRSPAAKHPAAGARTAGCARFCALHPLHLS